jgi:hypothetical protein
MDGGFAGHFIRHGHDSKSPAAINKLYHHQRQRLANAYLPKMDIDAKDMNLIVDGVMENKTTIDIISFESCALTMTPEL